MTDILFLLYRTCFNFLITFGQKDKRWARELLRKHRDASQLNTEQVLKKGR